MMEGQQAITAMGLGADMDRRMIFMVGEIDGGMLYRFMTAFKIMDQTPGPIAIFLCSPGGSMTVGFALYDMLRTANNPTVIQGTGMIASMATVVLQGATMRFLTPETRVMVHNCSLGIEGNIQAVQSSVVDTKYLNGRMLDIISERTKQTPAFTKKLFDAETYFSAQEAVDAGLADRVADVRAVPQNYKEAVAQLNKALPEGYSVVQTPEGERLVTPESKKAPKKEPKKTKAKKGKK